MRKNSRRRRAYTDLGYTDYLGMKDYLLSPNLEGSQAMGLTTLEPQGSTGDDAYSHEGEEAGYILVGSIELTIEGETFILEAGDSYAFSSELSHRLYQCGEQPRCIYLVQHAGKPAPQLQDKLTQKRRPNRRYAAGTAHTPFGGGGW